MVLRADMMVAIRHALERLAARQAHEKAASIDFPNPVHPLPVLSAIQLQRELHEGILAAPLPRSNEAWIIRHGDRASVTSEKPEDRHSSAQRKRRPHTNTHDTH